MKKRQILAWVLAIVLAVSLCPVSQAEGDLLFVAVNDTVPLTLTALPYDSGSGLYVPYTVFDATPGGVVPAYNEAKQTFVLFTIRHRLVFDLAAGTVTDENQNVSSITVTYRNGILYLPLVYCASHFGLRATMLQSLSGYSVLRFATGGEVYDDALFIEKADNLITYRIEQYSSGTPTDPEHGEQPQAPDTSAQQSPAQEDEAEKLPVNVYLAFSNAQTMRDAMAVLHRYALRSAFFLTEDEITQNPDLVRSLYIAGHTLGLTVPSEEPDVQAALSRANDALDKVLNVKSVLALVDAAQAEGLEAYRVFSGNGITADTELVSDCLFVCSENAEQTLAALRQQEVVFCLLRETTQLP